LRKLFVPEVVQTSALDCGPATLKSLLEGFHIRVSYERLREACQTGLDGTSIDTLETVANQLGLQAEQIMIPPDHLLLKSSNALPAIAVVQLPNGLTHFVVVWRRHAGFVQVMDPAMGRRWITLAEFQSELFVHGMSAPASDWLEFACSEDFQAPLREKMRKLGISKEHIKKELEKACSSANWRKLACLDAAVRLMAALRSGSRFVRGEAERLLTSLCNQPQSIPPRYWMVRARPGEDSGEVLMRGAVLVRVRGKHQTSVSQDVSDEIRLAVTRPASSPGCELVRLLKGSGDAALGMLGAGLLVAAGATLVEALLFRSLFDIAGQLGLTGQRMAALAAIMSFSVLLFLMEFPLFSIGTRLGRQLENKLRIEFLRKIPRLSDRYFASRLASDMAERSHSTHRFRHLPDQLRQLTRSVCELLATASAVIWLEPAVWPFILVAVSAALVPAFAAQSVLAERDLRVRNHGAALTRFYLEAMLGLTPLRAHGAEVSIRREQAKLLGRWADASFRLQRLVIGAEALQLLGIFAAIGSLFVFHPLEGAVVGRALLLAYWALNIPALGQEIGTLTRQYPSYRNLSMRLLEPLGAKEERAITEGYTPRAYDRPPTIEFRSVNAEASGHPILDDINLRIEPGSQLAIVGPSGAGKSSLAGVLLGWLPLSSGEVLVNGEALDSSRLRASTAWVDPTVQLWNRSLLSNILYGNEGGANDIGNTIDGALLRGILETLPDGMQTRLGESGGLVSGGEGQRIRFARALLKKPVHLVILDEPFRGLDREKRRTLLAEARRHWRGSTLLCITHDLAETRSFDRVVVVENGRIREDGAPAELAALRHSRYAELLAAESQARDQLWNARYWRRIRLSGGRILEEFSTIPKPNEQKADVA
jgi:ABC-type bacteriocin/lantibiotic exporter with double-glycine peptidase domain